MNLFVVLCVLLIVPYLILSLLLVFACCGKNTTAPKHQELLPIAKHTPVPLTKAKGRNLFLDSNYAYWHETGGGVYRTSIHGGKKEKLIDGRIYKFFVDSQNIYWVQDTQPQMPAFLLQRMNKVTRDVATIASFASHPRIAQEDQFIYYSKEVLGPEDESRYSIKAYDKNTQEHKDFKISLPESTDLSIDSLLGIIPGKNVLFLKTIDGVLCIDRKSKEGNLCLGPQAWQELIANEDKLYWWNSSRHNPGIYTRGASEPLLHSNMLASIEVADLGQLPPLVHEDCPGMFIQKYVAGPMIYSVHGLVSSVNKLSVLCHAIVDGSGIDFGHENLSEGQIIWVAPDSSQSVSIAKDTSVSAIAANKSSVFWINPADETLYKIDFPEEK